VEAVPLIVSSVLTSTLVSGVVAAIMKYQFDKRVLELQHKYELTRAQIIQEHNDDRNAAGKRSKERRTIFPKIVTKVYRIRNAAREVSEQVSNQIIDTKMLRDALEAYQVEQADLEELLYELRLYLEVEGLFEALHHYKRQTQGFLGSASAILHLASSSHDIPASFAMEPRRLFQKAYKEIDEQQLELIHSLAEIVVRET
jgi:hypothetical protein